MTTTATNICGDGIVVKGESCDDGNDGDNAGCNDSCTGAIDGWECTPGSLTTASVCTQVCGDLYLTASEQCEDGNQNDGDGCDSTCQEEDGFDHASTTNAFGQTTTVATPTCGDGKVVSGEICDDAVADFGGTNKCKNDCSGPENGWSCSGGTLTTPSTCIETCGNGYITDSEQCEDGNLADLDGCDSSC